MSYRVSKVVVALVLVDEYDALRETEPVAFSGDRDQTAVEKTAVWLERLSERLAALTTPALMASVTGGAGLVDD